MNVCQHLLPSFTSGSFFKERRFGIERKKRSNKIALPEEWQTRVEKVAKTFSEVVLPITKENENVKKKKKETE